MRVSEKLRKQIIELDYIGLTHDDIAARLDVTVSVVVSVLCPGQ